MNPTPSTEFAVRFIGFTPAQIEIIEHSFRSRSNSRRSRYTKLPPDNLQDPDLYLIDASQVVDAAALRRMGVSPARPALLVGTGKDRALPAPVFHGRLDSPSLLLGLDRLVAERDRLLARLPAAGLVSVPERRRRERHADAAATQEYGRLRRAPSGGGILVVDESSELADHVAALLALRALPVARVVSEAAAFEHCRRHRTALVIINADTRCVDAYRLCAGVKAIMAARVKVVLLRSALFDYDPVLARRAGCDGFLEIPLAYDSLAALLKKFLPVRIAALPGGQ